MSRTQTADLALIAQARKCARFSTRYTAKATRVVWVTRVRVEISGESECVSALVIGSRYPMNKAQIEKFVD